MKRTWAIAPWNVQRASWEHIWQFDYNNNLISIGWKWLGNIIGLDEEQIREKIEKSQPPDESALPGAIFRQFQFFYQDIRVGDIILARKGLMKIVGFGVVTGDAYFDSDKATESKILFYDHPNFLPVKWMKDLKPIEFGKPVFQQPTIQPIKDLEILKAVENQKVEISDSDTSSQNSAIDDIPPAPIGSKVPGRMPTTGFRYQRDEKVRCFVIGQAKGACEYCGEMGFILPDGNHYLEAHHVIALAEQGPDTVENVIALCPSDHREAHYGQNAVAIENKMIEIIKKRKV
jgi:hypothetical protein